MRAVLSFRFDRTGVSVIAGQAAPLPLRKSNQGSTKKRPPRKSTRGSRRIRAFSARGNRRGRAYAAAFEDLFRGEGGVQGARETGIDGRVQHGFDNLVRGQV